MVSVWTPEPPKPLLHSQFGVEARVGIEQGFVKFTTPKLPSHHQRRVTHNYRTSIESGIETGLSSTRDNSKRKQPLLAKRTEEHFTLALSLALFPPCKRGEGRNRTRSLYRSEPNTLCFKAYCNLILQGFKSFLRPPVQRPLIAPLPPPHCSSGEDLGETFPNRKVK